MVKGTDDRSTNRPERPSRVKTSQILDSAAALARAMFRHADRKLAAKLASKKSKSDEAG